MDRPDLDPQKRANLFLDLQNHLSINNYSAHSYKLKSGIEYRAEDTGSGQFDCEADQKWSLSYIRLGHSTGCTDSFEEFSGTAGGIEQIDD